MAVACPECSTQIEAEAGTKTKCPNCGFKAEVPDAPQAPPEAEAGATADRAATDEAGLPLGALSYVLGVVAFLTFWLAMWGVPFLAGTGAVVTGVLTWKDNREDRRALIGMVLGGVAILFGVVFLLLF